MYYCSRRTIKLHKQQKTFFSSYQYDVSIDESHEYLQAAMKQETGGCADALLKKLNRKRGRKVSFIVENVL